MSRHERLIRRALSYAGDNNRVRRFKTCAILVHNGHIVSIGYNQYDTHTLAKNTRFCYLHAEIDAISKARSKAEGATLYVARHRSSGPGTSRPCPACLQVIREAKVKNIYYLVESSTSYDRLSIKEEQILAG